MGLFDRLRPLKPRNDTERTVYNAEKQAARIDAELKRDEHRLGKLREKARMDALPRLERARARIQTAGSRLSALGQKLENIEARAKAKGEGSGGLIGRSLHEELENRKT